MNRKGLDVHTYIRYQLFPNKKCFCSLSIEYNYVCYVWFIWGFLCVHFYLFQIILTWIILNAKLFSLLSHMRIFIFKVMSIHPTDWYQNAIRTVMPLHELKKFNFKSVFTLIINSWHIILLVIWKCSARAFYRWVVALSLNGNAAAHCLALGKKHQCFNMNPASFLIWVMVEWSKTALCAPVMWQPRGKCTCLKKVP